MKRNFLLQLQGMYREKGRKEGNVNWDYEDKEDNYSCTTVEFFHLLSYLPPVISD